VGRLQIEGRLCASFWHAHDARRSCRGTQKLWRTSINRVRSEDQAFLCLTNLALAAVSEHYCISLRVGPSVMSTHVWAVDNPSVVFSTCFRRKWRLWRLLEEASAA